VIVNRDEESRGPATSFALVAEAYSHGRPGYPDEATRWLVGESPRDVLDLGAGTGKLTRSLVSLQERERSHVQHGTDQLGDDHRVHAGRYRCVEP